jgi:hypothetical protein
MNNFTVDYSANREMVTIIETEMRDAMYYGSRFSELIGMNFAKTMGRDKEVKSLGPGQTETLIGAPIETVKGFKDRSGLFLEIPYINRLKELPGALGNAPLKGKEETDQYSFLTVPINRWRKAYAPPMGMQRQATKSWRAYLWEKSRPKLTQWVQDFMPSNYLSALHFGGSRELIAPLTAQGRAISVVSHPNMYGAGVGKVSYVAGRPGTAGYEASVETMINTINAPDPQFKMTLKALRDFIQSLPELKIKPLSKSGGKPLYPVFMPPPAFTQLRESDDYKNFVQSLRGTLMQDHPLAHLGEAIIDGAIIITDITLWYAYTAAMGVDAGISAGAPEYGPRPTASQRAAGFKTGNTIDNLDNGNVACTFALGETALLVATGEELTFHEQIEDYDGVQGTGIDTIKSVVRGDMYNKLGLITLGDGTVLAKDAFYQNTGSAILLTYSPRTRTFGAV